MPASSLLAAQLGQEAAWGTLVPATARLMGLTAAEFGPDTTVYQTEEWGHIGPSPLVALTQQGFSGSMGADATYEDILYPLYGLFGDPATVGGGGVHSFAGPYAASLGAVGGIAANSYFPYTIEYGPLGELGQYALAGAFFKNLTVSWTVGEPWKWTADIIAKSETATTMTTLSPRVVELITGCTLAIDVIGGTMGATAISQSIQAFTWSVESNRHLKTFGAITPGGYGDGRWTATLSLDLEWNATVKAYVDALIAAALVQKQIRLSATGTASKAARLDFAGHLDGNPRKFADRDGNMGITLAWTSAYNSTYAGYVGAQVTNGALSLP